MYRYEIVRFKSDWYRYYSDCFDTYQVMKNGDIVPAYFKVLRAVDVSDSGITFEDSAGQLFETFCMPDGVVKIGDRCSVPCCLRTFGSLGVKLVASVGYSVLKNPDGLLSTIDEEPFDSSIILGNKNYKAITDRFIISIVDDSELPDRFFKEYNMERNREYEYDDVDEYLDTFRLLKYNAKYNITEDDEKAEDDEKCKKRDKRLQSFDSRQSKLYLLDRKTHRVLRKTPAMLTNHKGVQFGLDANEYRLKENKKLFDLCKQEGYNTEDVIYARKEIGGIRVKLSEDDSKEVRARFVEVDINTHQDINNIRYLQDGSIIDVIDGEYWFVDGDEYYD